MLVSVCWQKNGNRFVPCVKWSYLAIHMCVAVCASTATCSTHSSDSHSTWTEPNQLAFVPTFGSLWPIFHFPLRQHFWQYECRHNKYTPAITTQLQVGTDPARAIADGNLLKIKQGREVLNMFWQCPRVFNNQSLHCCFLSACSGRTFHGEVINQLKACIHKAGTQLIRG